MTLGSHSIFYTSHKSEQNQSYTCPQQPTYEAYDFSSEVTEQEYMR
jgi:hypothetical protein